MPELKKLIENIEATHAAREQELLGREEKVKAREAKAKAKAKELAELEKKVNLSIEENQKLVSEIRESVNIEEKEKEIAGESVSLVEEKRKLRAWENKLARIEKNQEGERKSLSEGVAKLETDKKSYRAKIKKEFFEQLEAAVK